MTGELLFLMVMVFLCGVVIGLVAPSLWEDLNDRWRK